MSLTYAIPDLHGRLDLLELGIEVIARHAGHHKIKVVTLGDYVDRGPESRAVLERLMNWRSTIFDLVCLKGNHEAMMWATCHNQSELNWWLAHGGDQTLLSYGAGKDLRAIPEAHLRWIAQLPLLYSDRYRVFVHAAVDPEIPLGRQSEQTLLWKRYPRRYSRGHGAWHVVHGHDATPEAPVSKGGRTNLDGLAWKTGRLVIGVFDDDRPGGAVEFIEAIA